MWQEIPSHERWPADFIPEKKRDYWKQQDRYNSGLQNGSEWQNKIYETVIVNQNLILCVGGRLHLKPRESGRAVNLMDRLDLEALGLCASLVAYAVCAYVVHQSSVDRQCHPQTKKERRDETFEMMREDLDITKRQFEKTYGKIQHRARGRASNRVRHDKYELDNSVPQSWRSVDAELDDGHL